VDVVLAKYHVPGKIIATEPGNRPFFRGLRVDYTSLLVQQPGAAAAGIPRGILVTEVQPDSPAARADLKPGLVTTHLNDRPATTRGPFYEAVAQHTGPLQLPLSAPDSGQPAPKVSLP